MIRSNGYVLNLFEDTIKFQSKAYSILSRSHQRNKIASTYLFHGPDGTGHWGLAVTLTALLNCLDRQVTNDEYHPVIPCGRCRHCRLILGYNFEGFYPIVPIGPHKNEKEAFEMAMAVIEAKKNEPFQPLSSETTMNIPVERAREVKKSLAHMSAEGIIRVVLFYGMEKMLTQAADALLKMIEEPPSNTVLILTTQRPERLLPTIQSRAQKIRLERVPDSMLAEYLQSHYDLSEKQATITARLAEGRPGRAIEMIQSEDEEEDSRRNIGFMIFKAIFEEKTPTTVGMITEMVDDRNRSEAEDLLRLWQSLVRDCAYYAVAGNEDGLVNVDFKDTLIRLAPAFEEPGKADKFVEPIKNALADFRFNVHIQPALVALVLKLKQAIEIR